MHKFILLPIILGIILITLSSNLRLEEVNYKVGECEIGTQGGGWEYDEISKTLVVYALVNCCGTNNITVKKEDSTYKVIQKHYGEICRCLCTRKVTIFNVPSNARLEYMDEYGNLLTSTPIVSFCGRSTYGTCESDGDCVKGGCSNEICQSKYEGPIITTCEFKECYDYTKYKVECKCISGKCQWVKE